MSMTHVTSARPALSVIQGGLVDKAPRSRLAGSGGQTPLLGIAIATGLPTLFWTGAIYGICRIAGYDLGLTGLSVASGLLALFLLALTSALMSRA